MATEKAIDTPRRIAVLISGSGTNLQALMDACNTPRLPRAQIVLVLSNRKAAYGLTRATTVNPPIPTIYLGLPPFLRDNPGATRVDYDLAVAREVLKVRPDVLVLAGWMHIVSEGFLEVMRGVRAILPSPSRAPESKGEDAGEHHGLRVTCDIPVINIHPALPGQFDGANAMEHGFEAFQRGEVDRLGVMVHRVIAEVDRGAPIIVREVEVHKGEDLKNDYEPRMHRTEWEIIVEAAKLVLDEVRPVGNC
ncbi:phosphoribosylglycinamide formyltransferase [Boletus reticuloceps]|uniref:phosphoribosylglycinamide formyltransferase 1 n=1 Tax=Boletus reticuloceps TaxID=495285 RepID=A0A8I2YGD1_9AGAM|nr:phosphoribosylglycinamide formyltransferase [Boletus reticuloceps]